MNRQSVVRMSPLLEFSYSQFFVYDAGLKNPACAWTDVHSRQGFARRDGVVAIGTLLEFGRAQVVLEFGKPSPESFERVVSVPLEITSGTVAVDGPEETPRTRELQIENGHYRATIAQKRRDDTEEEIKIWLEKVDVPLRRSELIVVDQELDPPTTLLETAEMP
jgi:hypothetical protein